MMSSIWAAELMRSPGKGFGFSVIGGTDTHLPPMVCALVKDSPALNSGKVHVGDVIVKVNGIDVHLLPSKHIVEIIRKSSERIVLTLREDKMSKLRARPFLTEDVVTDPPKCGLKTRLLRSNSGGYHSGRTAYTDSQTLPRNVLLSAGGSDMGLHSQPPQLNHCNGKANGGSHTTSMATISLEDNRARSLNDRVYTCKGRSPSASDIYKPGDLMETSVSTKANSASDIYTSNGNSTIYGQQLRGKNAIPLYRNTRPHNVSGGSEPPVRRLLGGGQVARMTSDSVDRQSFETLGYHQQGTAVTCPGNGTGLHGPEQIFDTKVAPQQFPNYPESKFFYQGDRGRPNPRSTEMDTRPRGNQLNYCEPQMPMMQSTVSDNYISQNDSPAVSGHRTVHATSTLRSGETYPPGSQRMMMGDYMSHGSTTSLGTARSQGISTSESSFKFGTHERSAKNVQRDGAHHVTDVPSHDNIYWPMVYPSLPHSLSAGTVMPGDCRGYRELEQCDSSYDNRYHKGVPLSLDSDLQNVVMNGNPLQNKLCSTAAFTEGLPYDRPQFEKISPPTRMLTKDSLSSDSSSPVISSASFETDDNAKPTSSLQVHDVRSMDPTDVATRLFTLEGFESADVAPLLGKNNEFSQQVCREYLQFFNFEGLSLDDALRQFLGQFPLTGETQERERILVHFSRRFYECNKPPFASEDAVHTLTCALMLLNTDLHGQTIGSKMNLNEFISNLSGLCDGKDFPRELLKTLYQSIKGKELVFSGYEKRKDKSSPRSKRKPSAPGNPSAQLEVESGAVVLKEGLMYRKCVMEADGRKTPAIRRGWKLYYGVLKGLVLFLYKPDQVSPEQAVTIGIHHALAGYAAEYKKRPFVYKIITADWRVFMFQAKSKQDAQEWVDALNISAAALSAPPLPAPVSSCKRFQRPVMPVSVTRLNVHEQLKHHREKVSGIESDMKDHREQHPGETPKEIREWEGKIDYLEFEHKRFLTYVGVLSSPRLKDKLQLLLSKNGLPPSSTNTQTLKRSTSLGNMVISLKESPPMERKNSKYRESYLMAVSN